MITLLKNDEFTGPTKIEISFTLTCVLYTGYNELQESNAEIVLALNQVFNECNENDKYVVV